VFCEVSDEHQLCAKEYYEYLFDGPPPTSDIRFAKGGQYIVPRDAILRRPKEFYQKLLAMLMAWEDYGYLGPHEDGMFRRLKTFAYRILGWEKRHPGIQMKLNPSAVNLFLTRDIPPMNAWTLERLLGYIFLDIPLRTKAYDAPSSDMPSSDMPSSDMPSSDMPSYSILVAHHQESLDWLYDVSNVVIYDKGPDYVPGSIPRPNIGREGESFLYHIVMEYDDLPEFLICIQANPFDHMSFELFKGPAAFDTRVQDLVRSRPDTVQPFFCRLHSESYDVWQTHAAKYYEYLFDGPAPSSIEFAAGGQYIIPRDVIMRRPKKFYKKLLAMITAWEKDSYRHATNNEQQLPQSVVYSFLTRDIPPMHGWTLERLFPYIFSDIPLRDN